MCFQTTASFHCSYAVAGYIDVIALSFCMPWKAAGLMQQLKEKLAVQRLLLSEKQFLER